MRRLLNPASGNFADSFNPRPTYVRRLKIFKILWFVKAVSILAPRMWGDYNLGNNYQSKIGFNPRPTYVRRPSCIFIPSLACWVSILAPRLWGDPSWSGQACKAFLVSILAPRMWGDVRGGLRKIDFGEFQSSPHVCEATLTFIMLFKIYMVSILAPRMWGDAEIIKILVKISLFQSSPHVCEATNVWLFIDF